jgi:hypothetical protein
MRAEIDRALEGLFRKQDAGTEVLDEIRGLLNRRRYISNLVREVEKELNVHAAN